MLPRLALLLLILLFLLPAAGFPPAPTACAEEEGGGGEETPPPPEETGATPEEKVRRALHDGIKLFGNRSYDKAFKCFDDALRLQPDHTVARYYRGVLHVYRLDYKAAVADFDRALKARPDEARVYAQRGRAYMALNRFAEAKTDFQKALRLDPKMGKAYLLEREVEQAQELMKARKKVGVGKPPPVFKLPDASGATFDLGAYLGKSYVVLVFYATCDLGRCRDQLSRFNEALPQFQEKEAVVATISTDRLKFGIELLEKKGLRIRILSDEDAKVTRAYGLANLRYRKPPQALPAVVIVGRKGQVAFRQISYDPRVRPTPEKILKLLDGMIKKERSEKAPPGDGKDGKKG
jgi:peroxiredoxin Q/BCP